MKLIQLNQLFILISIYFLSQNALSIDINQYNLTQGIHYASAPADARFLVPIGDLIAEHINPDFLSSSFFPFKETEWVASELKDAWSFILYQLRGINSMISDENEKPSIFSRDLLVTLNEIIVPKDSMTWQYEKHSCLTGKPSTFPTHCSNMPAFLGELGDQQFNYINQLYDWLYGGQNSLAYRLDFQLNQTSPEAYLLLEPWMIQTIINQHQQDLRTNALPLTEKKMFRPNTLDFCRMLKFWLFLKLSGWFSII